MSDVTTWLPAPGISGYEISSDGRIRSIDRWVYYAKGRGHWRWLKGVELKRVLNNSGYPTVTIRRRTYSIHALVCTAFHGPRPSQVHQVRHRNAVRTDNRSENLQWGTPSENQQDKIRHGNHPQLRRTHCPQGHPYDEQNTYTRPNKPGRYCKQCHREKNRIFMREVYRKRDAA